MTDNRNACRCLRCGYLWLSKTIPTHCARCKRSDWSDEQVKPNKRKRVSVPFYARQTQAQETIP